MRIRYAVLSEEVEANDFTVLPDMFTVILRNTYTLNVTFSINATNIYSPEMKEITMLTEGFQKTICCCFAREIAVPPDLLKEQNAITYWQKVLKPQLNISFLPVCRVMAYNEMLCNDLSRDHRMGRFCAFYNKRPYRLSDLEYQQVRDLARKKQENYRALYGSRQTKGRMILHIALTLRFTLDETNAALISYHNQPLLYHRVADQLFACALQSHWSYTRFENDYNAYQKWEAEKTSDRNIEEAAFFQRLKNAGDYAAHMQAPHLASAFLTLYDKNLAHILSIRDTQMDEQRYQRLYDLLADGERAANGAPRRAFLKTARLLCPDFHLFPMGKTKVNTCRKLHRQASYALLYEATGGSMPNPLPASAEEAETQINRVIAVIRELFIDKREKKRGGVLFAEDTRNARLIVYRGMKRMLANSQDEMIQSLFDMESEDDGRIIKMLRTVSDAVQDKPDADSPYAKHLRCVLFYLLILCDCTNAVVLLQERICEMMRFFGVQDYDLSEKRINERIGFLLFSSRPAADIASDRMHHHMESMEPTYRFMSMLCIYVFGNHCEITQTQPDAEMFRKFLYYTLRLAWPDIYDIIAADQDQSFESIKEFIERVFQKMDKNREKETNLLRMRGGQKKSHAQHWHEALRTCLDEQKALSPFREESIICHNWTFS